MVFDYDVGIPGYNLFAYCGNNPVNRIDISGKDSEPVADLDLANDFIDDKENGKSRGTNRRIPTANSNYSNSSNGSTPKNTSSSNHGGKWRTIRVNHWKSAAANSEPTGQLAESGKYILTQENIDLMKSGKAPYGTDGRKVQLHHTYGIANELYVYYEILATDHWAHYKSLHPYLYE